MQDYIYSSIGAIAIVVQMIINFKEMFTPDKGRMMKAAGRYRLLLLSILVYFVTDVLWGILGGLEWTSALFVNTTIYFVAMSAVIVCFYNYLVDYLEIDGRLAKFFRYFGFGFFILENLFLIVNIFYPCFFWFDADGAYVAGTFRYVVLWIQVAMFAFLSFVMFIEAMESPEDKRGRYFAIFFFSLTMLCTILLQERFALIPFYALGCMIGCCILHVYVAGDELDEYRRIAVAEKEKAVAASRAKTSFLARMSHDIRTPLNGIIGLLEISDRHADDLTVLSENRAKEKVAAGHLLSLINDVLQMSKLEDGSTVLNREAVDIEEQLNTIRTIIELRAVEMGIRTEFTHEEGTFAEKYVFMSPLHFRQVLMNIFSNALKYNRPNGSVHGEVSCLGREEGKVIYRFVISDTGIGMSGDFQRHLFEPFSQERSDARSVYNGTGLGMSIVKALIDKMGGTVRVESRVGEGTTFFVTIPFEVADESDVVSKETVESVDLSGRSLLLVEDNDLNAEIATELLEDAGAKITRASDGLEAVDTVRSRPAGSFDAVLMDVMMPIMNGYDATRTIRMMDDADKAFIPIIAMTANAYEEDKQNALNAGMNGFVPKPVSIPDLMRELGRILH